MWTWLQSEGDLWHDGRFVHTGYSGFGEGKNNPAMQEIHGIGPLPKGKYKMKVITENGQWVDYEGKKAPVIRLFPAAENNMFGRDGFLIHGDNKDHTASHGCVIEDHDIRVQIALSGDEDLEVV